MNTRAIPMSDDDRSFIAQALRLAGERYRDDAHEMRELAVKHPAPAAYQRLAQQFDRQVDKAHELADLFDDAAAIAYTR